MDNSEYEVQVIERHNKGKKYCDCLTYQEKLQRANEKVSYYDVLNDKLNLEFWRGVLYGLESIKEIG